MGKVNLVAVHQYNYLRFKQDGITLLSMAIPRELSVLVAVVVLAAVLPAVSSSGPAKRFVMTLDTMKSMMDNTEPFMTYLSDSGATTAQELCDYADSVTTEKRELGTLLLELDAKREQQALHKRLIAALSKKRVTRSTAVMSLLRRMMSNEEIFNYACSMV